jgi:hypothetical protein
MLACDTQQPHVHAVRDRELEWGVICVLLRLVSVGR